MSFTEQQVIDIAKKILKDLDGKYYREDCIEKVWFEKEEELIKGTYKGAKKPCWTVFIKSLFQNTDFLIILDETGEPLYYQNFNLILTEVIKKEDGTYDYKD